MEIIAPSWGYRIAGRIIIIIIIIIIDNIFEEDLPSSLRLIRGCSSDIIKTATMTTLKYKTILEPTNQQKNDRLQRRFAGAFVMKNRKLQTQKWMVGADSTQV